MLGGLVIEVDKACLNDGSRTHSILHRSGIKLAEAYTRREAEEIIEDLKDLAYTYENL